MSTSLVAIFLMIASSVMPAFAADVGVGIVNREVEERVPDDGKDPNGRAKAANQEMEKS